MTTLHITNGDSTVELLKAANLAGTYLPWRDVLHMGPVPMTDNLAQLSQIRADYLASLGWGDQDALLSDFKRRDDQLAQFGLFDEVILWFEHDLYDQLQLIQLLSWFEQHNPDKQDIMLINPGKYLGHHRVDEVPNLLAIQQVVTDQQLLLAKQAWFAFRQKDTSQWQDLLNQNTSSLPFLSKAIMRSIGELPNPQSGINQTEKMMLNAINKGFNTPASLFKQYCQEEEDMFLGDMGFFWFLKQLQIDQPSLVSEHAGEYSLTSMGLDVLDGKSTWQREYTQPRWLGGFCISSANR